MRWTRPFLTIAIFAALMPAAFAAERPTVVVQVSPISKTIADIRHLIASVAGPGQSETAIKEFEKSLEDTLGEMGFDGLDVTRPLAAYANVPDDPAKTVSVLVLPITGEKEFLALLKRLHFPATEQAGNAGLYKVENFPKSDDKAVPTTLRFADGLAYVAINDADGASLAAEKRVPLNSLIQPGETADLTARLNVDRIPKATITKLLEQFNELVKKEKEEAGAAFQQTFIDLGAKFVTRNATLLMQDASEVRFRLGFDQAKHDMYYTLTLVPKPGTPLAKSIAEWKPTPSPIAGLVSKETCLYYGFQLPLFAPELREIAEAGMTTLNPLTAMQAPPPAKPIVDEIFKGLSRTFKAGHGDLMLTLNSPNKDGHYTAMFGFSFEDSSSVEKAFRDGIKGLPEPFQSLVTFDADKAGKTAIHKISFGDSLPERAQAVFGPSAVVALAFAPDAIIVGFGPDSIAAVKAALLAPPGTVKAMGVAVHPKKVLPLIQLINPLITEEQLKKMNFDLDSLTIMSQSEVIGGKELTIHSSGKNLNVNWLFTPTQP